MRRNVLVSIVVLLLALIVYRALTMGGGERPRSAEDVRREKGIPVDVAEVTRGDIEKWEKWAGEIEGWSQSVLRSSLLEKIVDIPVREGQNVRPGDVIVRFDRTNRAAMYNQAKTQYENAKRRVERLRPLFEDGALSEEQMDEATSMLQVAEANWKAAESSLDISSPIAGTVTDIMASVGDTPEPGEILAVIASTETVRVDIELDEKAALRLSKGMPVRIESSSGEEVEGQVVTISMSADPETRLFSATAVAKNPNQALRVGSYTSVWIRTAESKNTVLIPQEAVIEGEDGTNVFVVEDGIARERKVSLGVRGGGVVEVLDGVQTGMKVITRGKKDVIDGDKVAIHSVETPKQKAR